MKFLLTALITTFCTLGYSITPKSFQSQARINIESSGSFSIPLEDILASKIKSNSDIRIFDSNSLEVPFYIEQNIDTNSSRRDVAVTLFNQSELKGKFQQFQFNLEDKVINRLLIKIDQKKYSHSISIFGRDNKSEEFKLIKDKLRVVKLHTSEQKIHFEHNTIKFPAQRYSQYKVQIDLSSGEKPLNITSVYFREKRLKKPIPQRVWKSQFNKIDFSELKNMRGYNYKNQDLSKLSVYKISLPHANSRVDKIEFYTKSKNFERRATLYFLEKSKGIDNLRYLSSTTFFSYGNSSNKKMNLNRKFGQNFLLVIQNEDNYPLKIENVAVKYNVDELRFFVDSNSPIKLPLALYLSPNHFQTPNYDIKRRINSLKQSFTPANIGELKNNASYDAKIHKPASEQIPYLAYSIFGLLAMFCIGYVIRMFKKAD